MKYEQTIEKFITLDFIQKTILNEMVSYITADKLFHPVNLNLKHISGKLTNHKVTVDMIFKALQLLEGKRYITIKEIYFTDQKVDVQFTTGGILAMNETEATTTIEKLMEETTSNINPRITINP